MYYLHISVSLLIDDPNRELSFNCQAKSKSIQVNSNWIGRRWYYFRNFPTIYVAAAPIYVAAAPIYVAAAPIYVAACPGKVPGSQSL